MQWLILSPEEQMAREASAYRQMLPALRNMYLGQSVAFYQVLVIYRRCVRRNQ